MKYQDGVVSRKNTPAPWLVALVVFSLLAITLAGCGSDPAMQPVREADTAIAVATAEPDTPAAESSDDETDETPTEQTGEEPTDEADDAEATDEAGEEPTDEADDAEATPTDEADEEPTDEADDAEATDEADDAEATDEADDAEATDEADDAQALTMETLIENTRHFKGDSDAPVVIIEFSDFQCPYCSRFADETAPQIEEAYIENGTVRLGYRHAAYHGGDAYAAAEASECAADQGAFWEYHDLLIKRLTVEGESDFPPDVLKQYAADLDLDSTMFETCLETGTYSDLVREETERSSEIGISGTPSFIVNGKRLVGAQPFSAFEDAIEEAESGETDPASLEVEAGEEGPPRTADELMGRLIEQTRHFKGEPDAPVVIIEFSDFQCPYCSKFASETAPQIEEQYIEDGTVRLGYIHAAYHGGEAYTAAEASECAADQDAFWEYHDLLVDRMEVEGESSFPTEVLKQYAADLDLDTDTFDACLDDGKYADLVREQTQFSSEIGVQGTPTFAVNGKGLVGAQPFSVFEEVIEAELEGE